MGEEIIAALQVLESIRTGFKSKCRKLVRQVSRLDLQTLGVRENSYRDLESDIAKFQENLNIWEDLLPKDQEGQPIYPQYREKAGGIYADDRATLMLTEFQVELHGIKMELCEI